MGATNVDRLSVGTSPGRSGGSTAVSAAPAQDGPTLGALVASASRDLSTLIRSEIDLAKAEIKDDVAAAAKGGGMLGGAAVLGILASIVLSFALAYGLAEFMPTWLAFLIVGVLYLVGAGVLALVGKKALQQVKPPQRAIETTKESVAVLKGAATS